MAAIEWPDGLCPNMMDIGVMRNNRVFDAINNHQQVVVFPGEYWTCRLHFDSLAHSRQAQRRLSALLGALRGMRGTVKVPAFTRRRTDSIGNVVVVSANNFSLQMILTGFSVTGTVFRAGDYITVAGQMFEVVQDSAVSGGNAVIELNKAIRGNVAPGTAVEYRNPWCEMRQTTDEDKLTTRPLVSSAVIELREAF